MTDQHPENNKVLHELLGKTWHELVDPEGYCTCEEYHNRKLWPSELNPDYADDPRLVLEGMRERKDFLSFLRSLFKYTEKDTVLLNFVVNFILDRTGRLRDLAIEFLRRER